MLAIDFDIIDLGARKKDWYIQVDKGRGPKAFGIVCRIAKLRWFEPSYYILGEHGFRWRYIQKFGLCPILGVVAHTGSSPVAATGGVRENVT